MKKVLYVMSIILPVLDIVKGVISGIKKGLEDLAKSELEKDDARFHDIVNFVNSEHGNIEVKK